MILVSLPQIFRKDAIVPDPAADALYRVEAEEFLKGIQQEESYGEGGGGSGYGAGRNYDSDRNYKSNRDYSNDRNYNGNRNYSSNLNYSNDRNYNTKGRTYNNERSRPYNTRFKPRSFDPNTATAEDYIAMGFSEKQAAVIIRYRDKGGSFRVKEDFSKLYVVDSTTYKIFEPYIQIENTEIANPKHSLGNKSGAFQSNDHTGYEDRDAGSPTTERLKSKTLIELNSADSVELIKIYGVGPVFASRIMKYRYKTGGFYSIEQLAEVYGIDSTRYAGIAPQVRVDTTLITKININTITLETLRRHPYFDYYTAKAIIDKRVQTGSFKTMDEIKQVLKGKDGLFERVKGYVLILQ